MFSVQGSRGDEGKEGPQGRDGLKVSKQNILKGLEKRIWSTFPWCITSKVIFFTPLLTHPCMCVHSIFPALHKCFVLFCSPVEGDRGHSYPDVSLIVPSSPTGSDRSSRVSRRRRRQRIHCKKDPQSASVLWILHVRFGFLLRISHHKSVLFRAIKTLIMTFIMINILFLSTNVKTFV